jgi:hypothetical protein
MKSFQVRLLDPNLNLSHNIEGAINFVPIYDNDDKSSMKISEKLKFILFQYYQDYVGKSTSTI